MSFFRFFGNLLGGKKKPASSEPDAPVSAPKLPEKPGSPAKPAPQPEPVAEEPAELAPEPVSEPAPIDAPAVAEQALRMFAGAAAPLSQAGFDAARTTLSIATEALWAVMNVESRGAGFLPSGRPKILFEGHWFSRLTSGVHDAAHGDISYPNWTRDHYLGGEREYERLERAVGLDREAALKSTSWGLGQVMGFNAEKAGFTDVEDMVAAMSESEDAQLRAMAGFIHAEGLESALADEDWRAFAEVYNGPGFEQNNYDGKLEAATAAYRAGDPPNLSLRTLQHYLERLGFAPGLVDGLWGPRTNGALNQFLVGIGQDAATAFDPVHVTLLAQAASEAVMA